MEGAAYDGFAYGQAVGAKLRLVETSAVSTRADIDRFIAKWRITVFFFFFFYLSCHTPTRKRAERRARNIAGAEALAVARRPEVASREKNPVAAGIGRFFPLSKKSKEFELRWPNLFSHLAAFNYNGH